MRQDRAEAFGNQPQEQVGRRGSAAAGHDPVVDGIKLVQRFQIGKAFAEGRCVFPVQGEILALLGRNGAGKTSTLRSIARTGTPEVRHGEIWLDHQPLHTMTSYQAATAGLGLVPEDRRIIPGLTVEENLKLAQIAPPVGWSLERLYTLFPRLGERRMQEGVTLSGGEQQMLAIARALARDIKVLLLDEPYEGLAPVIVDEIEKTLRVIKEQGMTTILVEQNAVRALQLADRAIILDTGTIVFDGSAKEVLDNKELREEYLAI